MKRDVTVSIAPGEQVCIISSEFAGAGTYRVWSEPVEVLVEPSRLSSDPDVVDMTFREHACPEFLPEFLG